MTQFDFIKMHGLGNDFVIIDARTGGRDLDEATVRAVADRKTGIGCDQLIIMEPARMINAAFFMRIRNADGSEVDACGNAARCVADRVMAETGKTVIQFQTGAGLLTAHRSDNGITVDMGPAQDQWSDIPLAAPTDTLHLPIKEGPLSDPAAVGIGNPPMVFFVDDAQAVAARDVDRRSVRANIERLHAENPEAPVIIQPHPDSTTDVMIHIMDSARQAGVYNVSLAQQN